LPFAFCLLPFHAPPLLSYAFGLRKHLSVSGVLMPAGKAQVDRGNERYYGNAQASPSNDAVPRLPLPSRCIGDVRRVSTANARRTASGACTRRLPTIEAVWGCSHRATAHALPGWGLLSGEVTTARSLYETILHHCPECATTQQRLHALNE